MRSSTCGCRRCISLFQLTFDKLLKLYYKKFSANCLYCFVFLSMVEDLSYQKACNPTMLVLMALHIFYKTSQRCCSTWSLNHLVE
uniref:Uncharacterized protein n=1 Tax=Rhizophora mucronata TaxID=61149 RepID=A0A2P2QIZ1_RHIMU